MGLLKSVRHSETTKQVLLPILLTMSALDFVPFMDMENYPLSIPPALEKQIFAETHRCL